MRIVHHQHPFRSLPFPSTLTAHPLPVPFPHISPDICWHFRRALDCSGVPVRKLRKFILYFFLNLFQHEFLAPVHYIAVEKLISHAVSELTSFCLRIDAREIFCSSFLDPYSF